MWKKLIPKSIRGKIMLLTAAITLLITILTTTVCFVVFQSFLRKNQIQSSQFNLQIVSNNIASDMKDIVYFSKWCCSNDAILDYLENFRDLEKLPTASKDTKNLRSLALSSYKRLREEYYNTRANEYISRVIVSANNEKNFLQIADTTDFSTSYAAKTIKETSFFENVYESPDFLWVGLVNNPFSNISDKQFIPIVRPVFNEFNSDIIGFTYVEISAHLFTDYLTSYPLQEDSMLYLTIGEKNYVFQSKHWKETSIPYTNPVEIKNTRSISKGSQVLSVTAKDGVKRILIKQPVEGMKGWYLSQILSENQFKKQNQLYTLLIIGICVGIVSLGLLLGYLLNKIIMEPIHKLSNTIKKISSGDFSRDKDIEWNHELGQIGHGINNMSENIISLMKKRVTDEQQKKDLEYQILQSQINPHFLYNTLNSIKWMATIQNATGIADMTTALARLLKNVSKGTTSFISLNEELALVKDYFLIQQYRYGGSVTIEYCIESEDLYDCKIHRFTLQPIIENALFHGIEPKGTTGKIVVSAQAVEFSSKKALKITITDNGIGMTEETIQKVLKGDSDNQSKTEFFRHVGISNVNKRLRYDYGSKYGITITSIPGEFTTMTIYMPYMLLTETNQQEGEGYD